MSNVKEDSRWRISIRELLGYLTAICFLLGLQHRLFSYFEIEPTALPLFILWVFMFYGMLGTFVGRIYGYPLRGFWFGIGVAIAVGAGILFMFTVA